MLLFISNVYIKNLRFITLQATLGEVKKDKGNESVYLYANIGGQKLVLGTLSAEKFPHISLDLVFEKKFQLSHNWKNGSVYFCGYKVPNSGGYPFHGFIYSPFLL